MKFKILIVVLNNIILISHINAILARENIVVYKTHILIIIT
jgi:hypothetical protein